LIVSLVGLAAAHGLPLDPAIPFGIASLYTTIVVLYILKIGLHIFCEYTERPSARRQKIEGRGQKERKLTVQAF
jgi:hypothetical protein